MKQTFINEVREKLQTERERLLKELTGFAVADPKAKTVDFTTTFPEFGDDEDENANEIADYSNKLSLENALEKELRDILDTLISIENKTYGVCKYCKGEISEERLRARPTSTSCIACKKTLTQEL